MHKMFIDSANLLQIDIKINLGYIIFIDKVLIPKHYLMGHLSKCITLVIKHQSCQ